MSEPMLTDLPDAARLYLEGKRLDEVECIISDLPGIARGKAVLARRRTDGFTAPSPSIELTRSRLPRLP